jgi:hypothetical protein
MAVLQIGKIKPKPENMYYVYLAVGPSYWNWEISLSPGARVLGAVHFHSQDSISCRGPNS